MNLHIRKATPEDLETLLTWGEALWKTELAYEERMLYSKDFYRQQNLKELRNEHALILIGELGEKPVGYLYAHIDPAPDYLTGNDLECEIEVIYLEPEARGQGLARELIEQCLLWVQEKNVRRVKTGIYAQNTASLNAFRKSSFHDHHITLIREFENK
jgi:RimJ/RimL family protein N-acetyltransferase